MILSKLYRNIQISKNDYYDLQIKIILEKSSYKLADLVIQCLKVLYDSF